VRTVVSQGCEPVGRDAVITNAEGNVVFELAGEPALERLKADLANLTEEQQRSAARGGVLAGLVIDENRSEYRRGDYLMRGLIGVDEDTGALAVGEPVRVGQTLRFHVRDAAAADEARILSLHGISRDAWLRYTAAGHWRYDVLANGHKYNMTDVAASLGSTQLAKSPAFHARRRALAARYDRGLAGLDAVATPPTRPDAEHAWHLYVIRVRPGVLRIDRDRFIEELRARNIGTSVHFIPLHLHPYYRQAWGYRPGDFPNAEALFAQAISLPLYPAMSEADLDDVVAAVTDVVRRHGR
jgi:hypothetical protein